MVWTGISYGQWTLLHFIDGNLNAQRYRDEIMRPIVVPFIHCHHLMFQHDNAQPHVTRICTQFLKTEHVPVLPWPANWPDVSPVEHVWNALDRRVWYLWSTNAYVYSQPCQIHILGPNEFILINWYPYMNCNSVKILEIVACWVYIFVRCTSNQASARQARQHNGTIRTVISAFQHA